MNEFTTGNLIRKLRLEKNITQRKLAETLQLTHTDIQAWEDGQVHPSEEMLQQIAVLFHVTKQELINGKLDIPEDPYDVYTQWIITRVIVYGGLCITLFGLSLYIFALSVFAIHLFVIVMGILFSRFVLFEVHPKRPKRQYVFITGILVLLILTLLIVKPNYYSVRTEEYVRINDIKEHLYLRELHFQTDVVTYYNNVDQLIAMVYIENEPNIDIVNLSRYQTTDIYTISTNQERVIDVLWAWDKIYVSTVAETTEDHYKIYQYNPNDLDDKQVIFQSDEIFKIHGDGYEMFLISHPEHSYLSTKLYFFNSELNQFSYIKELSYTVWDLQHYMVGDLGYLLASTTSDDFVDGKRMHQVLLLEDNLFTIQEVLIGNLEQPIQFEGFYKEVIGYNEDAVYKFNGLSAKKVFGINGFLYFTIIEVGLYYGDGTFYDEQFNVIQKRYFYDEDLNQSQFGRKMIPDQNGNLYTLDNEFIGFAVQMPNEFYRWVLPLGLRILYLVVSIATFGIFIRIGQTTHQSKI